MSDGGTGNPFYDDPGPIPADPIDGLSAQRPADAGDDSSKLAEQLRELVEATRSVREGIDELIDLQREGNRTLDGVTSAILSQQGEPAQTPRMG